MKAFIGAVLFAAAAVLIPPLILMWVFNLCMGMGEISYVQALGAMTIASLFGIANRLRDGNGK